MAERARLVEITDGRAVTKDTDPDFWFHYQRAILLALKDNGILNEEQLLYAEAALQKQRRDSGAERGGDNP